jgi:hypothetical protein
MKRGLLLAVALLITGFLSAQDMQMDHSHGNSNLDITFWFGLMELPFLFLCVYFAFKTAIALKGGIFGNGMKLMAWGFLVMAIGHMHMQLDHLFGINIFNSLLGYTGGNLAWFIALVVTWSLSGLGFYSIYKASSGNK